MIITAHESIALVLAVMSGVIIPALSALVTKYPGWWTGVATLALSTLAGFVGEWAAAGDSFNWRAGAATAASTFVLAVISHAGIWRGTTVIAKLHAIGATPYLPTPPNPPAAASPLAPAA